MKLFFRWRLFCLGVALACSTTLQAFASDTYDIGLPHPRTNVPYEQALKDAQYIASQQADWQVARCEGFSMSPFFSERSVLLVKTIPFEKLREGMIAVYLDSEGDLVAHKVHSHETFGWRCQALQSDSLDPELVTAENFEGIAFAVFNASSAMPQELLAQNKAPLMCVVGKFYDNEPPN